MKKIIFLLAIVGMAFIGCDPLEDINNEIDALENPVVGVEEYTLTDEDYETLELEYGNFNSEEEAKEMLPDFIADMFPNWGNGSSVTVNYNLYIGDAEGVSDYTSASTYELSTANYASTGSDVNGFYPDIMATDEIPTFLEEEFTEPEEGQLVLVTYNHYTEVPVVGISEIETFGFNGSLDGFESINVTGDGQVWEAGAYGGAEYAIMSGYDDVSFDNEDWLISPEIDLEDESSVSLQINQAINYADDVSLLSVLISSDYSSGDDVTEATWEIVDFELIPSGDSWDFILSEDYDLSDFEGETVHVALRYISTVDDASTWEVDQLLVKAIGIAGDYDVKGDYFTYTDGSWEAAEGVYYLSSADYNAMGESSNQPGQYDNFSSAVPPSGYVPALLSIKHPYAQEEDELFVVYKYYSSGETQIRGDLYTFTDGVWVPFQTTIATTLQFGFEDGVWVPDNTIRYTLTNPDYEYIHDAFVSDPEYTNIVGTLSEYHNYDYNWTSGQVTTTLLFFLDYLDPNAEEGQKYAITYVMYDYGSNELTETFIKEGGEWIVD
ncbi:choice-of-anchor J domain-containing protein [Winogradskyella vidalii]|uniref:choice-of-anchor J domain-containing protein n=1 Tax=Winogradskyella vidalii TaxID=2615024 RepID=UPI0015C81B0C|nr:choice-of-anchor J domain-containing protein [Winogradskyella vidalii]